MHHCLWRCISLAFIFQIVDYSLADDRETDARRLMDSLNQAQNDITSMLSTVDSLDGLLSTHQKRACNLGINSHHCALADYDRLRQSLDYISSGHSPGKRTPLANDENKLSPEELKRLLEDIVQKRLDLEKIKSLLHDANANIIENSKRTCTVELGGACRTEWASSIADQYYYLMSPHSPGRRRRSFSKRKSPVQLFNKQLEEIRQKHSANSS